MNRSSFSKHIVAIVIALVFISFSTAAQTQLSADMIAKIDKITAETLTNTGVPSASVAVVKDGQIVFTKAYGDAKLDPKTAASPTMRYSIGSISKQFTSAAMLLLQEQGKLSLDDRVSKYVPDLTRANEVTIRQLLSHTSGYQDYWPQDYVMPGMLKPTTAKAIMDSWAKIPLDFEPGTKWQYSNTNFVIAGVIIEKVSGMPLMKFLQEKVFAPLGMKSVADIDAARLGDTDPTGYLRYALGPLRAAPKEGPGWLFAAGELPTPTQEQRLIDRNFEVAVRRFDIAVLVGLSNIDPLANQTVVCQQIAVGERFGKVLASVEEHHRRRGIGRGDEVQQHRALGAETGD